MINTIDTEKLEGTIIGYLKPEILPEFLPVIYSNETGTYLRLSSEDIEISYDMLREFRAQKNFLPFENISTISPDEYAYMLLNNTIIIGDEQYIQKTLEKILNTKVKD